MPRDTSLVHELWELYRKQGKKNGKVVTVQADFFHVHMNVPSLQLITVRDMHSCGQILSFRPVVRTGEGLISMCGDSHYAGPRVRDCRPTYTVQVHPHGGIRPRGTLGRLWGCAPTVENCFPGGASPCVGLRACVREPDP